MENTVLIFFQHLHGKTKKFKEIRMVYLYVTNIIKLTWGMILIHKADTVQLDLLGKIAV